MPDYLKGNNQFVSKYKIECNDNHFNNKKKSIINIQPISNVVSKARSESVTPDILSQCRYLNKQIVKRKFLQNACTPSLKNDSNLPSVSPIASPLVNRDIVQISNTQDYSIKECGYKSLKNHIKIPQNSQLTYDPISGITKERHPPDIHLETHCSYLAQ